MTIAEKVRLKRDEILKIADQYGATDVRIFGSVAKGIETPDSDLDVLVDFHRSLIKLIAFERELKDLLGCKVDVVTYGGLRPYLKDEILGSAVPL